MSGDERDGKAERFDPASLRIDPADGLEIGVKKILTHVPVRKPNPQEFFRVHTDPSYRICAAVLDLKEEREFYLVRPEVAGSAEVSAELKYVDLLTCITRAGTVFLWPLPRPDADGRINSWHQSARAAAEVAENQWTRLSANRSARSYDVRAAPNGAVGPTWPEATFRDLLELGFANGRLIEDAAHPVLKRLRGE